MNMLKGDQEERWDQCMICLEDLTQPMKCSACCKYICQKHAVVLTRCPNCRSQPFVPILDEQYEQRLLVARQAKREAQRDTATFQCHGKGCPFKGNYAAIMRHREKYHPYLPIDMVLYGDYYEILDQQFIQNVTVLELRRCNFALQNRKRPPKGHKKKVPDFHQALKMVRHCDICPDTNCHAYYTGPWGSFIGGAQSRTQFDLTMCAKGREMNEQLGWNYSDCRY